MKNSAWTYSIIVAVVIFGLAAMSGRFFSYEKRFIHPETIREGSAKPLNYSNQPGNDPVQRGSMDHLLYAIFGAALVIGCLAGVYIRRRPQDPRNPVFSAMGNLSSISADTGINEYELFRKAAENWAVSEKRIAEDFRTYLASQHLPYYVTDYARKSQALPEQVPAAKKSEPSSWSDWIKALLVFPGVIVFLYVAVVFLA